MSWESDWHADRLGEIQAERDLIWREIDSMSNNELAASCKDVIDEMPKEVLEIVKNIIDYWGKHGKVSDKQRGVLVNFLTEFEMEWR